METTAAVDPAMLQQALHQAGQVNIDQAAQIEQLVTALRAKTNELLDWQQRYRSVSERLAEAYPQPTPTPRYAFEGAGEPERMRAWVSDLEQRIAHAADERRVLELEAASWRRRAIELELEVEAWAQKYANSGSAPGSGPLPTQPTSVAPVPSGALEE